MLDKIFYSLDLSITFLSDECATQWFQSSILVVDIATNRLNWPRGQFSENHLKCITMWVGRDEVTNTSFSSIQGVNT